MFKRSKKIRGIDELRRDFKRHKRFGLGFGILILISWIGGAIVLPHSMIPVFSIVVGLAGFTYCKGEAEQEVRLLNKIHGHDAEEYF